MWKIVNNELYKKFTFDDFKQAFAFISRVADVAEELNHHPRIHNTWNTVELWLSTHSEGGVVTDKDHNLAKKIDEIVAKPTAQPRTVIKEIKLYGDGGSRGNPGPSASGYVLMDMNDNILKKSGVYLGVTTNNQAEYQSLRLGLEEAYKMGAQKVNVFMDSLLVINQMKGVFKVKNRDLWPIYESIKDQLAKFKEVTFTHVPREFNKLADAEVNTTLDAEASK